MYMGVVPAWIMRLLHAYLVPMGAKRRSPISWNWRSIVLPALGMLGVKLRYCGRSSLPDLCHLQPALC